MIAEPEEDEEHKRYMQNWSQKLKKGKFSREWTETGAVDVWRKARMTFVANMER